MSSSLPSRLGRRAFLTAVVATLTTATLSACYGKGKNAPEPVVRTTVRVINQGFLDRNIYAYRGSQRVRIGTVIGNTTQVLTIPSSLVQGGALSLRFVADPIGGRAPSATQEIAVSPGDEVQLTIPPG